MEGNTSYHQIEDCLGFEDDDNLAAELGAILLKYRNV
jgi:hypothetical protein